MPKRHPSPARRFARNASLALSAVLAAVLAACSGGGGGAPPEFPPPQVNVATPVQKAVTEWDEYSGRIQAVDSLEIRPRVAGYLAALHFEEGMVVEQGARLFSIDDREYRAAEASARADLARAEARLALAERELTRSRSLVAAQAVSQGELESRQAERQQAEADVLAARARLEQARLTLGFTDIRSPIAGRVGAARIKPGNLVSPDQTLLTTVVSLDPVHVAFEGDEQAYLRYQQLIRDGQWSSPRESRVPVEVGLSGEQGFPHRGEIVFIDNALNPSTGTILAKASLANPEGVFTPGLFARVRLLGASRDSALLIHEQALLTDQDRRYVYVIGEGNSAQRRDLRLGPMIDGLRVVEEGLSATDQVVVNGTRKIFFPGQPVTPLQVPMSEPNAPAPAVASAATASSGS